MQLKDIQIGKIYRKISNGFVFKVKDFKFINGKKYMTWSALNRKSMECRTFQDDVSKIKEFDFVEENFEKYD